MRITRERAKNHRAWGWRAETVFWAEATYQTPSGRHLALGMGSTPDKARLDLLYNLGRRRTPPVD